MMTLKNSFVCHRSFIFKIYLYNKVQRKKIVLESIGTIFTSNPMQVFMCECLSFVLHFIQTSSAFGNILRVVNIVEEVIFGEFIYVNGYDHLTCRSVHFTNFIPFHFSIETDQCIQYTYKIRYHKYIANMDSPIQFHPPEHCAAAQSLNLEMSIQVN